MNLVSNHSFSSDSGHTTPSIGWLKLCPRLSFATLAIYPLALSPSALPRSLEILSSGLKFTKLIGGNVWQALRRSITVLRQWIKPGDRGRYFARFTEGVSLWAQLESAH